MSTAVWLLHWLWLLGVKNLMSSAQNGRGWAGAFARFMVSNHSPSSPMRFLFWAPKCQLQIVFAFHHRLKNRVVFLASLNETVSVPSETLSQTLRAIWHYLMSRMVKQTMLSFFPGSTGLTRRTRFTRGPRPCRRRQSGTTGMRSSSSQCCTVTRLLLVYLFLYLNVFVVCRDPQEIMGSLDLR